MAVSDVNMSSEGSDSSSRLRQFGLYKNIDSRTAEFLKLSRKRQIRRGCACAAVSTAITVTVVVSALLVYEYGFHTESKLAPSTLRKFNWFNAVNDSEVTFDQNKGTPASNINNNKLLPIILKALDQRRYLETLIEEQSSTHVYEKTTDYYTIEKNLFTDARNWRGPQLKLGEIGYKGPPRGFYKQRHVDSFINARKLIDYQRIMTYLNAVSLNKKVDETHQDHIYSTWKPSSSTGSYKTDFLYQYNYNKAEVGTNTPETTETIMAPRKNYITPKETENKYCQCPKNNSNLADILKKLYNSIQQLRPRKFQNAPNSTDIYNGRHSEITSVIVNQPHVVSNQSMINPITSLENIARASKNQKISFFRLTNKTITFKPETATLLSENSASNTDKTNNLTNKPKTMPVVQNDYYMPLKNRGRFKEQEIPWKLDFGIKANDGTTTAVYMNTEKTINITSTSKSSPKINRNIKEKGSIEREQDSLAREKENATSEKDTLKGGGGGANQVYINEDEEHDFVDEIDHIVTEANQFLNAHSAHVDKEKNKVFEEYNYLANYMDGLSKLYSKTFIVNKPQTAPPVDTPTLKPFDLKRFFSYEAVDPLVKLQDTTSETSHTFKPIQWLSKKVEKQRMSTNKLPPSQPIQRLGKNRRKGLLEMPKTEKPYIKSQLEETTGEIKQSHGHVLVPMIQSYLLSKHDSGLLNLNFDTTTSVDIVSTKGSEELPFDLSLFSDEESDHIYTNIINNVQTTTSTTSVRHFDKGKSQPKKSPKHTRSTESTLVKGVKKKKGSKKRKLPKARTWAPPTIKYPKTFTSMPVKPEPKNHKIKEIFYMTGSETPPDDFEANLHELMYFDRNPINYTVLTNSFLNKTDSGSIEITKSMMPETRPSYLEIRRNHNHEEIDFDTHIYDERNS